jgi:SAM-dependent methyltransferase
VVYEGTVLPAPETRYGGEHFKDNSAFLKSGRREVERLINHCGLTLDSSLLEVGCGRGRLPIAILRTLGGVKFYAGLDVDKRSIEWCQKYIWRQNPAFTFVHLDLKNERYNPRGKKLDESFSFPLKTNQVDVIYLYSVFSHLKENDIRLYLKEFKRILAPDGKVFLTAFVQDGVPNVSINPTDYVMDWSGPLHCVRYEKSFLCSLFTQAGFTPERVDYETETDKQSAFYLRSSG